MNEYRCTRRKPYYPDCVGHTNVRARQGYYIRAATLELALLVMEEKFPEDFGYGFDGELWRTEITKENPCGYICGSL